MISACYNTSTFELISSTLLGLQRVWTFVGNRENFSLVSITFYTPGTARIAHGSLMLPSLVFHSKPQWALPPPPPPRISLRQDIDQRLPASPTRHIRIDSGTESLTSYSVLPRIRRGTRKEAEQHPHALASESRFVNPGTRRHRAGRTIGGGKENIENLPKRNDTGCSEWCLSACLPATD